MRLQRRILAGLCTAIGIAGFWPNGHGEERTKMNEPAARQGVVVTVSAPASEVGAEILRRGGNAVDAAVATAFALTATFHDAGNIGGGGFMIVFPGDGGTPTSFDFRETAPAAATKDMFVKPADRSAHRRVGVPGTVRGLALAHGKLGKLPWKDLVLPAVKLAGDGFTIDKGVAKSLNDMVVTSLATQHAELRRVFARPGGGEWKPGDRLVQPDLKKTLSRIAEDGPEAFYTGPIADQIVAEMKHGGGLINKADLAGYKAVERKPVHGVYRGLDVYGMAPPSSGGTMLVEMLNILENFDFPRNERFTPRTVHILAETMRRAYRDRARFLGDPGFTAIPAELTDKAYAKKLAQTIDLKKATPSKDLAGDIALSDGEHTTHFSIIDDRGMAVSLTYTLEDRFGGRVLVRGAGFLLNDEMNDFSWLPGITDTAGRIGTSANQIVPGKRMLSSMTPTIVAKAGKPILITGSPGGRTIINTVLCVVVNVVDFGMDVQAAVDAPRMHHQWFPDKLRVEPDLATQHPELIRALALLGHQIDHGQQGDAHSIWIDPVTRQATGAADKRISGKVARK